MRLLMLLLANAGPLEHAQDLERRGDDVGALVFLESAVRADPLWAMGRVEVGRLQLKKGTTAEAYVHLDIARTLSPENPRAHYLFALAADETGHRNEARRALEVALQLRDGYSDAQMRLANLLSAEGDFASAVTLLRQYLAAHPEINGARLQLADALERSGDSAGGEKELRKLLHISALKVIAGRRLAALLQAQGRNAEADKVRQNIEPPRRQLRELKRSGR